MLPDKLALQFPEINLPDLTGKSNLINFLTVRSAHLPAKFAFSDLGQMSVGIDSDLIDYVHIDEFMMIFDDHEAATAYGRTLRGAEHDGSMRKGFKAGEGLAVMERQNGILGFLVDCCRKILHDASLDDLPVVDILQALLTHIDASDITHERSTSEVARRMVKIVSDLVAVAEIGEEIDLCSTAGSRFRMLVNDKLIRPEIDLYIWPYIEMQKVTDRRSLLTERLGHLVQELKFVDYSSEKRVTKFTVDRMRMAESALDNFRTSLNGILQAKIGSTLGELEGGLLGNEQPQRTAPRRPPLTQHTTNQGSNLSAPMARMMLEENIEQGV